MYLEFHGLIQEPFRLTPDPRFLHLTEEHRATFLALTRGVLARKGFMVMIGAVGTGKTTLLNTLLQVLSKLHASGSRKFVSAFLVNPVLNRDEFLEYLLQEFEISCPSTTKPRRLLALHELFLDAQKHGGTTLLIIDEAHLLPVEILEEVRLLTNFDSSEKLVQVILCGQPELATLLLNPPARALRQRIALITQIGSLPPGAIEGYITHRLRQAGLKGPIPFSRDAVDEIYNKTQGVPRLINSLCDRSLEVSCDALKKVVDQDVVRAAASGLTFVGARPLAPQIAVPPVWAGSERSRQELA